MGNSIFSFGFAHVSEVRQIYLDQGSAGSRGRKGRAPRRDPNSFNFMQFLGNLGKIVCWRPPGELVPPPRGNPGSATARGGDMSSYAPL